MFGEKTIEEQSIIPIKNNKIVLPKSTGIEVGETIYSTIDLYQRKIILMNKKDFYQRLNELKQKLDLGRQQGTISYSRYIELQRYIWGILCLHEREINKKREYMLFSNKYEDSAEQRHIRRLNFQDKVFAIGVGTRLEIYPSEQAYQEDLTFQKEKGKK